MDPVVVWLGWLALFLIYELYAAISKPKGDTLSEGIWGWFGVKGRAARRFSPLRRGVPLAVLALLALPLVGCKDCEQLQAALIAARASGNATLIQAAEQALAGAKCGEPAADCRTQGCPNPNFGCEKTSLIGEPERWSCVSHCGDDCPTGWACKQTGEQWGCVEDPVEPACPATCPAGTECTDPKAGCVAIAPPQSCPAAPQGALVCAGSGQCGCWACSGRTGYLWVEMPACPPPAGCSIDGEPGPLIAGRRPELGGAVNEAMVALRPDCSPGGRCVLTEGRQAWQARVVAELRRRGLCSGQHTPETDEVAAATSATAPREGWHVYAGADAGPGTVVWSPGAARPAYAAPATPPPPPPECPAAPSCPAGEHAEVQSPGNPCVVYTGRCVADAPTPPLECPAVVVNGIQHGRRQMVAKLHSGKWYHTTPRICGDADLSIAVGRPGQYCAPLGPECSEGVPCWRHTCEELFLGGPTPMWQAEGDVSFDPGPLAWLVSPHGTGRIRACDRAAETCSAWLDVAWRK